jgi:hypothetical protein
MAQAIWRDGSGGGKEVTRAGKRDRSFEETIGRERSRNRCDERGIVKKMVSAEARREIYRHMKERGLSARRSSKLSLISRSSAGYKAKRNDEPLAEKLRAIASRRIRFGYRRAYGELRKQGEVINYKRVERVW